MQRGHQTESEFSEAKTLTRPSATLSRGWEREIGCVCGQGVEFEPLYRQHVCACAVWLVFLQDDALPGVHRNPLVSNQRTVRQLTTWTLD